jgi:hypothetical protein
MTERGNDGAMCRLDARVHRCGDCGTWCLGARPCTTCEPVAIEREAS